MLSRGNRGVARLVSCARARRIVRQAERPSLTRRCAAGAPGSSGLLAEQLPKAFDHAAVEDARYRAWEEAGAFQPRPGPGEPFVVAMPPPNVTGALHMGHAMFVTVQVSAAVHRLRLTAEPLPSHRTSWCAGPA